MVCPLILIGCWTTMVYVLGHSLKLGAIFPFWGENIQKFLRRQVA